ncbi:MAG: hypothetical protein LBG96_00175, partial [Tannerella sp.]|nr:hypothetical protein [Tannerella sp.]
MGFKYVTDWQSRFFTDFRAGIRSSVIDPEEDMNIRFAKASMGKWILVGGGGGGPGGGAGAGGRGGLGGAGGVGKGGGGG